MLHGKSGALGRGTTAASGVYLWRQTEQASSAGNVGKTSKLGSQERMFLLRIGHKTTMDRIRKAQQVKGNGQAARKGEQ